MLKCPWGGGGGGDSSKSWIGILIRDFSSTLETDIPQISN